MTRTPSQPPGPKTATPLSGIGYYKSSPLPVDVVASGLRNFFGSLFGPPVSRLAATNDPSATYFGTNLIPAILDPQSVPAAINQPGDLETAVIQSDTYGPGVAM